MMWDLCSSNFAIDIVATDYGEPWQQRRAELSTWTTPRSRVAGGYPPIRYGLLTSLDLMSRFVSEM